MFIFVVILASLINQCLLNIVPAVIRIVNLSLFTGTVSNGLKQVVVTLLLKQTNKQTNNVSDVNGPNNFRPVSNLLVISVTQEKSSSSTAVPSFHEQLTRNSKVCLLSTGTAVWGVIENPETDTEDYHPILRKIKQAAVQSVK